MMTIVNFAHPLRTSHIASIEAAAGATVDRVVAVPTHFDHTRPFAGQVVAAVDSANLSSEEWQTLHLVIVPPSLAVIACLVMAEIHGRAGYFVPVVRLGVRPGVLPPAFEVAEVLDVQGQRESARSRR
jgi:hypothetical protein